MNEEVKEKPVELLAVIEPPQTIEPVKKEREVAYRLSDRYFKDFEVVKSANAWWMDKRKVEDLISSFKNGYNIKESCIYTGIAEYQYKYFLEIHPEFSTVKEACEMVCTMMAETGNAALIKEGDGTQIRWYLERRKSDKYGKTPEGTAPVLNNFGTIINQTDSNVPQSIQDYIENEKTL